MTKPRRPRRQCAKCPWKVTTNPRDIPGGYNVAKHEALRSSIADPNVPNLSSEPLRVMACHESEPGAEYPCVGWLANQLGDGNNVALRLSVVFGRIDANFELVGEQHPTFEDTLPKDLK